MAQIVEEDESSLKLDISSKLYNNPFKSENFKKVEEKTFDDFNNKINEFTLLIDETKEVKKTWMDTIIDNKDWIFTAINVFGFCYGMHKLKKENLQITKQLYENTEKLKELDLNLFRIETYTKYLVKKKKDTHGSISMLMIKILFFIFY